MMKRHPKSPPPRTPAYRRAFERLNAVLGKEKAFDNREKIRAMRRAYFADIDQMPPLVLPG